MEIRIFKLNDYDKVYQLWMNTPGMGLNDMDDSKEGISKVALVTFTKNELENEFWELQGFSVRDDLKYKNKCLKEIKRIDT